MDNNTVMNSFFELLVIGKNQEGNFNANDKAKMLKLAKQIVRHSKKFLNDYANIHDEEKDGNAFKFTENIEKIAGK